jgi:hypothetical protein
MKIKHGDKEYILEIRLFLNTGDGYNYVTYDNAIVFSEAMSFEYPDINFESVVKLYNDWLNKINSWISHGGVYMDHWKNLYVYAGIVNKEVVTSMKDIIIRGKMYEKEKEIAELSKGLITKITTYGWDVYSRTDQYKNIRVDYYTKVKEGGNSQTFDIYVYNDKLVLMNGNKERPTIITGNYFLYNAGEKKDK